MDPFKHHRRSIRLPDFDYAAPGAYFVTICTWRRELFFDQAVVRQIAEACWREIPAHAPRVYLDEWIMMPNHIHGIIVIRETYNDIQRRGVQLNAPTDDDSAKSSVDPLPRPRNPGSQFSVISPQSQTLGVIIRTYKAAVTTACRSQHQDFAWQRGYYDHVVRHSRELDAIRRYTRENPLKWELDRDHPVNMRRFPPATMADYLREAAA